jgi:steroid delta-isomerase-like uncharacterized protein
VTAQQPIQPDQNAAHDSPFRFLGVPTALRSSAATTSGAFGLLEHSEMPPGFATPYHTHHREEEAFYVLEGEIAFLCGGRWLKAGPGGYVFGPREIPHGFKVTGDTPARMLILCAPAGFEGFVLEQATPLSEPPAPPDMAKLASLAATYGIDIHGPLPPEPETLSGSEMPSDLKALNHKWIRAFNERDWRTESAVRAPGFRAVLSGMPEPLGSEAWSGFLTAFTAAFPDCRIAIDACAAEGDTVVTRWTLTGTHLGEFQGIPPTGRKVVFTGIEYNRVSGGRITEHWSMYDNVALLRRLGALPG